MTERESDRKRRKERKIVGKRKRGREIEREGNRERGREREREIGRGMYNKLNDIPPRMSPVDILMEAEGGRWLNACGRCQTFQHSRCF